jgi:uncharacterized protein (TIGR03437 family)
VTVNVSAATVVLQSVLHGATLSPTPVSPGLIVTISGTGLGPTTGVAARPSAAGTIETRLADVRVLFDGVPAPLLFVRSDQINAIVPYALFGRLSARVQVEYGTSFSVPIEAKVVDAAPGIFTTGVAGRGQAAAMNSDLTSNSLANPARESGAGLLRFYTWAQARCWFRGRSRLTYSSRLTFKQGLCPSSFKWARQYRNQA